VDYQAVFKRYELKYLLTKAQQERVLEAMQAHMSLDEYGRTTIRNIYFDTQSYRLIRRSIEKPAYKEKLRLRSYSQTCPDSAVFVELKKKYNSVVYKRRLSMTEAQAVQWLQGTKQYTPGCQISREIDYFRQFYETLHPVAFLSYEREAYHAKDRSDFRVTFDDTVLCRQEDLTFDAGVCGTAILPEDEVLMEIKGVGGMPLWMARISSVFSIWLTVSCSRTVSVSSTIWSSCTGRLATCSSRIASTVTAFAVLARSVMRRQISW